MPGDFESHWTEVDYGGRKISLVRSTTIPATTLRSSVGFPINEPPWVASQSFEMLALDGAFDETVEEVTAELPDEQLEGANLLFVYAQDADGNIGPPAAVWVSDPGLDFESGFESP